MFGSLTAAPARPTAWLSTSVRAALAVGIVGFLGWYETSGFVSTPPVVVLGLQLACGLVSLSVLKRGDWRSVVPIWPLVLFAMWAATTATWSIDPSVALSRTALITIPALALAIGAAADPAPRSTFVWLVRLIAIICILSLIAIAAVVAFGETAPGQALRLIDLDSHAFGMTVGGRQFLSLGIEVARYSGLASNPNGLALLAAAAFVALVAAGREAFPSRLIRLGLAAAIVGLLAVTLARSAIVFAVTGVTLLLLLRQGWRRGALVAVTAVLALPALLAALTALGFMGGVDLPLDGWERLEGGEAGDLGQRAVIWYRMLVVAMGVWPHGLGFGLTEEAVFLPLGFPTSAHSVPLTLLVETGVPGLALAVAAWIGPAYVLVRRRAAADPTTIGVAALLVALFAHQVFDASAFRYHWGHFLLAWLIGVAANRRLDPTATAHAR